MYKFSADIIYTGDGQKLRDSVIVTDHAGSILDISSIYLHDPITVKKLKGLITPGFINAHCHLELSHMKGKAETGTGLLPFLKKVVTYRDTAQEEIDDAISNADMEMFHGGIVAVGDISNKADTAKVKSKSKIDYYTFVEMFDFLQPNMTESIFVNYKQVFEAQNKEGYNKKSFVPHAPYTVSPELFEHINQNNLPGCTISIHNQETIAENELFLYKSGAFLDFYKDFGFSLDHFKHTGQRSIYYTFKYLKPNFKTIFVHNTDSCEDDILDAHQWNDRVFWATCANANLYIENSLPDYSIFLKNEATMTIGTDSLTSNWQLSVWEEIKTIRKFCSYVTLDQLIQWACINGARALSYEDRLGSISVGKSPGLVWIDCAIVNGEPQIDGTQPKRLI